MADVSESDTDTCVQKGQPNHGVRRWRAEGPGGEEGTLHAADLQIVPESRGLRKKSGGRGRGQSGARWCGYEETRPKCITEFHIIRLGGQRAEYFST